MQYKYQVLAKSSSLSKNHIIFLFEYEGILTKTQELSATGGA